MQQIQCDSDENVIGILTLSKIYALWGRRRQTSRTDNYIIFQMILKVLIELLKPFIISRYKNIPVDHKVLNQTINSSE